MANYYGIKLSRAIRERAYAAGEIERKSAEIEALQGSLKAVKRHLKAVTVGLAELDKQIARLSAVDAGSIRPIRRVPKSGQFKFGELSRTIIQILKDANGQVLETPEIVIALCEILGLDDDARKGAVERLHDPSESDVGRTTNRNCFRVGDGET